ncbi:MAG: hypothetical protein ABIG94_02975, partial [Pseudomonadota bacterium]
QIPPSAPFSQAWAQLQEVAPFLLAWLHWGGGGRRIQSADPPLGAEAQVAINIPGQVVSKPFLHLNEAGFMA